MLRIRSVHGCDSLNFNVPNTGIRRAETVPVKKKNELKKTSLGITRGYSQHKHYPEQWSSINNSHEVLLQGQRPRNQATGLEIA